MSARPPSLPLPHPSWSKTEPINIQTSPHPILPPVPTECNGCKTHHTMSATVRVQSCPPTLSRPATSPIMSMTLTICTTDTTHVPMSPSCPPSSHNLPMWPRTQRAPAIILPVPPRLRNPNIRGKRRKVMNSCPGMHCRSKSAKL